MQQYLITALILLPLVGAVATVAHVYAPYQKHETHYRWIALGFSVATFALSLLLLQGVGGDSNGFHFEQNVSWISSINARYHVGVDGISL